MECFFSVYTKPFMIRQFIVTFLEITIVFAGDLHKLGIKLGQLPTGCLGTGTIPPPPPPPWGLRLRLADTSTFMAVKFLMNILNMNSGYALFISFHYIINLSTLNRVNGDSPLRHVVLLREHKYLMCWEYPTNKIYLCLMLSPNLLTPFDTREGESPLINCMRQAKECTT